MGPRYEITLLRAPVHHIHRLLILAQNNTCDQSLSLASLLHVSLLRLGEDPIIAGIEQRISEWTHYPPEYQEPMQILRYKDGQEYDAHCGCGLKQIWSTRQNVFLKFSGLADFNNQNQGLMSPPAFRGWPWSQRHCSLVLV